MYMYIYFCSVWFSNTVVTPCSGGACLCGKLQTGECCVTCRMCAVCFLLSPLLLHSWTCGSNLALMNSLNPLGMGGECVLRLCSQHQLPVKPNLFPQTCLQLSDLSVGIAYWWIVSLGHSPISMRHVVSMHACMVAHAGTTSLNMKLRHNDTWLAGALSLYVSSA